MFGGNENVQKYSITKGENGAFVTDSSNFDSKVLIRVFTLLKTLTCSIK